MSDRFPCPTYPNGWFRVAYSHELTVGDVAPLQYFGRDLVMFRDERGDAHVLDAHCRHLGAHLGYGGAVEGDGIRCPFHAWKWNGAGICTDIPYAKRIPPGARIGSWPSVEKNGLLMVHHDAEGAPPSYEVPDLPQLADTRWTPLEIRRWRVRSRWLDMNENAAGRVHSRTDYGPGFQTVQLTGSAETLLVRTSTPIDEDYIDVSFAYTVNTEGDAARAREVGAAIARDLERQFAEDHSIRENEKR